MHSNIHIRDSQKEREKEPESSIKEIIAENFLNPGKEIDIQIQESQNTQIRHQRNPHWDTLYSNCQKSDEERILKTVREKRIVTYKGTPSP